LNPGGKLGCASRLSGVTPASTAVAGLVFRYCARSVVPVGAVTGLPPRLGLKCQSMVWLLPVVGAVGVHQRHPDPRDDEDALQHIRRRT
jgi:hypothetical protein